MPAKGLGFFMPTTLANIEIEIEQQNQTLTVVKASLQTNNDNAYVILLSKSSGQSVITTLNCDSPDPATNWLVQQLKQIVDEFAASTSVIKVIKDTQNLLPKITYRCSNPSCKAKLFESWGTASGIRIICRKCKTLGIPQGEEGSHV